MHISPDLLSAYLDGELTPDERRPVEVHLEACQVCAVALDGFRGLDAR